MAAAVAGRGLHRGRLRDAPDAGHHLHIRWVSVPAALRTTDTRPTARICWQLVMYTAVQLVPA